MPAPASEALHACLVNTCWRLTWKRSWFKSVFFSSHKYSFFYFIKWRLNHWCHMDYYNNVLYNLSGLVQWLFSCYLYRVRKLLDFIKNILISVTTMNKGLACTWWWVINYRDSIFWVKKRFLKTRVFGLTWYDAVSLQWHFHKRVIIIK